MIMKGFCYTVLALLLMFMSASVLRAQEPAPATAPSSEPLLPLRDVVRFEIARTGGNLNGLLQSVFFIKTDQEFANLAAQAEQRGDQSSVARLNNYRDRLRNEIANSKIWINQYAYRRNKDALAGFEQALVKSDLNVLNANPKPITSGGIAAAEVAKLRAMLEQVQDPIGSLKSLQFVNNIPLRVGMHNGQLGVVLTGIGSPDLYNKFRATPKERAGQIVQEVVLPLLPTVETIGKNVGASTVGVVLAYPCKNLMDKKDVDEAEALALVVPMAVCHRFNAQDIAQEDLMAEAEIYLFNEGQVKRVKLNLE